MGCQHGFSTGNELPQLTDVMTVKASRPHYFPASLHRGSGETHTGRYSGHLRYTWVCVRWVDHTGIVARIRADNVVIQNGPYDVAEYRLELPADSEEQLWQQTLGSRGFLVPTGVRLPRTAG